MDNSLKKLIDLANLGGNKFFVLDQSGEPQLVILSVSEYEKILGKKIQNQLADIEEINNKIIEAQKQDQSEKKQAIQDQLKSEVIDSTFSFEPRPQSIEQPPSQFEPPDEF